MRGEERSKSDVRYADEGMCPLPSMTLRCLLLRRGIIDKMMKCYMML